MYFSGQGKVFVATRDANGDPLAFRHLGNVPELVLAPSTDTLEHRESTTGQRLSDLRLTRSKSAEFRATLEEFAKENLALGLYGAASTISSGSATDEVLPDNLAVGDYVRLQQQKVSSVVVHDSAGSPATLVQDTDYQVSSADHGMLKILSLGAYTQPFKADYSYAGGVNINIFTQAVPERWWRFEGLNTADGDAPVLIEFYRVTMDPLRELALLNNDVAQFQLVGSILNDTTKEGDALLGQFGRIVQI